MTGMLFISRILGVARDALLTALLGATPAADALRAALKIPATIRDLLSEGAISAAFIPAHQDQKIR
ncbi:MAG: murein biosynthesis integral membrane protein MurJ, partial [Planctomycetes bacterium]|nr:murein biosynthesis integral membrane protein MurJ [Planctomycetota bacterium]